MRTIGSISGAIFIIAVAACQSSTGARVGYCTATRSIAIDLDVLDSATGVGIADSATGTVSTTNYQDSLRHVSDTEMRGGDRLGTYTVAVQRPGFVDWSKTGVAVSRSGLCGNVIPVKLSALLARKPNW